MKYLQDRSGLEVSYLSTESILPNPVQPRRNFNQEALEALAESIKEHGVIQPLSVRRCGGMYELIAGERRLRAARMAGLIQVPCVVLSVNMEESGLLALVENLQREDLDFVEEAEGIERMIQIFGMSRDECARRLGLSQSAIANKLRILHLPPDVLDTMRRSGLSERHGRALLRLGDVRLQRETLQVFIDRDMTVSAAEAYVDAVMSGTEEKRTRPGSSVFVLKDVRLFMNTVSRSLELMKRGGIDAAMKRLETEEEVVLTISIPKK